MIGQTVSHYRILEKLGAGGMGVVYKAEDTKLGRSVALKFLSEELCEDRQALKRFQREARAASALDHPNICMIHDIDEHEGKPFIAMELLDGQPLDHRISGRPLPIDEVLDVGIQVSEALEAAHSKGIIHRDIKPSNVFVSEQSMAKVLDFGLAKVQKPTGDLTSSSSLTEQNAMLGTVPYMAPEQLRNEAADARTDLHALGAVLYEMATGRRAFIETLGPQLMDAILHELPVSPRAFNPKVPPELERIILKCLEKAPQNRYQSAKELAVDLRRLRAPSVSAVTAQAKPPRASWRVAAGAATGVVAVAVLLVALNVGGLRDWLLGRAVAPRIQSLAVLPLANLSGDPGQEYFSDGMTDALIAELGQIGSLRVISRTSAMRYKKTDKPLPQIARELGVDALIEGSVLRSGDRVRITAQLIGAVPERHLWARNYERDLRDVLALQGEVARAIADQIKANVTPDVQVRLARSNPVNPEAHEAYLRGRYFWSKRTEEGYKKGVGYFEQALEKDPAYALAYTGLADCYYLLATYDFLPPKEAYPRAKGAATKALELDEALAEAHTSLAAVKSEYEWDWLGAEREFKRALELSPNYATGHHWYSDHLGVMGRHEEGIAESKRAQQLDPLSLIINTVVGLRFYQARRYDEAVEQLRKTLEIDPDFAVAHSLLGHTYEQKGQWETAIAEYRKAIRASGGSSYAVPALGHAYAMAGKRDDALRILTDLNQLRKTAYVSPFAIAVIHIALGEKDQAFEWLERAYQEHAPGIVLLKVEPALDPLRSDPRFQDLLRRMNFPE